MATAEKFITENLDIWSSAVQMKSATGRGKANKLELYGIKKLRALILELAVRGLLVPQDPNDESVSELLKNIAAEKDQLEKDGKIKKHKALPPIEDEEKPFQLPDGWEWIRLRNVGHDWGQKQPDKEFTYIDVGAINKELGLIEGAGILQASEAPSRARKIVQNGTVIYSTVRPYLLNIAVIDRDFEPEPIASTAFAIIHPFDGISASYIYRYLRSPAFVQYVENVQTGIAYPAINDKQFFSGLIPIPPSAEQNRIVAKVDELMALCDQLEQQQEASITAHQTLVQTLLDTLTTASERDGFTAAWARIADHFDTLFTTEWSIDQLKQTILQLAVMGKLVSQDPDDESASVLLSKVAEEKEQLFIGGKVKKQKPLPEVAANEKSFELPSGWRWIRLQDVSALITKGSSPKWQGVEYVHEGDGILFITSENVGNYSLRLSNSKYVEHKFNEIEPRSILKIGDILMNIVGASIGRTAVFYLEDTIANINQAVCLIRLVNTCADELRPYLLHFFNSDFGLDLMFGSQVENARANLSMGKIAMFPIPLPPLAEQQRIVANVDELMAVCDALKTRIHDTQTTQVYLANAIVEQGFTNS